MNLTEEQHLLSSLVVKIVNFLKYYFYLLLKNTILYFILLFLILRNIIIKKQKYFHIYVCVCVYIQTLYGIWYFPASSLVT